MKSAAYILMMALFTGCTTFQTNTDEPPPAFTRILIVSKLDRTTANYVDQYVRAFPAGYSVCTVDAGPLAFGNPDSLIRAKARQCNSQVVLTLNVGQNYQRTSGKYSYNSNNVLLEMATLPDRKAFWKGLTLVSALRKDALLPGAVIRQLRRDGIISGNMPVQQP